MAKNKKLPRGSIRFEWLVGTFDMGLSNYCSTMTMQTSTQITMKMNTVVCISILCCLISSATTSFLVKSDFGVNAVHKLLH